jgi:hypothetical protein
MEHDKVLKLLGGVDVLGSKLSGLGSTAETCRALTESLRAFDRSPVLEAIESVTRHQDAIREMLKPIDTLVHSSLLRDAEEVARLTAAFDSQYKLPALADITRLAEGFEALSASKLLTQFVDSQSSLERAMAQMATPWIDFESSLSSVSAFAELQGLGRGLDSLGGFDSTLTAALRTGIGDWRDPISWPDDVLADLDRRSDFYAGLGFNRELTAMPAAAFSEMLDISGLRRERPALVALYGSPVPDDDDDDFDRAANAFQWLHRLETQLRQFIDQVMTEAFGADWPRHRLPNGMHDQWQEKRRRAREAGGADGPLIAYADFTDYVLVICRGDNWRQVFQDFFGRPENVRESFQRLYPIRLDTMHARVITQDDELLLYVEAKRLTKMIAGD